MNTARLRKNLRPSAATAVVRLRGTAAQIARTAEQLCIYHETIGQAPAANGCSMGHSAQRLLFDPAGGCVTCGPRGAPEGEVLADLRDRGVAG